MVLDSKIQKLKDHFGISTVEDWRDVRPAWILGIDGIGPVTLDHLRLYLAGHDVCLQGDASPDFWRKELGARLGQSVSDFDTSVRLPFTILIDAMEGLPFSFRDIRVDAADWPTDLKARVKRGDCPPEAIHWAVPTQFRGLGVSMADYSIEGLEGKVHIERKSQQDAQGTILGWGDRRDRFERELENLAQIEFAAVVVECELAQLIATCEGRGKRSAKENGKILNRQVLAWMNDYRVPWVFCANRRMAELETFYLLRRAWEKLRPKIKQARKEEAESESELESLI